MLFEWLIAKYILKTKPTIGDCSAILTGLLLAFNLPSNLPWWIVVIGALVAIAVGKMSFGGLGQNPFNPALVGRVFLLISFPVQMTTWPLPQGFNGSYVDAATGATPLAAMKQIVKNGNTDLVSQLPDLWDLFIGWMGGSLGEVCALALLVGGVFLICMRVITCQHSRYDGSVCLHRLSRRYIGWSVCGLFALDWWCYARCLLYGYRLCYQPDDWLGEDYFRYRYRLDSDGYPYLGSLSRRYVVRHPYYERRNAVA